MNIPRIGGEAPFEHLLGVLSSFNQGGTVQGKSRHQISVRQTYSGVRSVAGQNSPLSPLRRGRPIKSLRQCTEGLSEYSTPWTEEVQENDHGLDEQQAAGRSDE